MTLQDFPDALRASTQLNAGGWCLQRRPSYAPRHTIGYYKNVYTGESAYLIAVGGRFVLQSVRPTGGAA